MKMKWKRAVGLGVLTIAYALLVLAFGLVAFENTAVNEFNYNRHQRALDVYEDVGVSMAQLQDVQHYVARYLNGEGTLAQINREVTMFGIVQPIFNEREMAHMRDVGALFVWLRRLIWVVIGLFLLLNALGRRLSSWDDELAPWMGLGGLVLWGLVALCVGIGCGFNFDALFLRFHELMFSNDLWLLDPRTDAMIRMYPAPFFERMARDIAGNVAAWALVVPVALPLVSWGIGLWKGRRQG